jgi:hypothetical protein
VIKTDKSGKLAVTDKENYLELGKKHIEKDRIIERKELRKIERELNGHAIMWAKMTNIGENYNHTARIIDSKVSKSNNTANMYMMLKDHKATLAARPVVSGCDSNTLGMSNSVSEFLEAVANSVADPFEVISGEDLLARFQECNEEIEKEVERRKAAGEEVDMDDLLYVIASDVVGLFPNIKEVRTGLIVREQVIKSPLQVKGVNYKEVARYVRLNKNKTGPLGKLWRLMPWRKKTGGTEPGMRGKNVHSKNWEKWVFPRAQPMYR